MERLYLAIVAAAAFGLITHAMRARGRGRGRWGEVTDTSHEVGGGAYRTASLVTTRPRPAPGIVNVGTALTRVWAALTLLVFAPLGLLGALVAGAGSHGGEQAVLTVAWLAVVGSGFGLGVALVRAAGRVDRRDDELPRRTTPWSYVHHVAVALVSLVIAARLDSDGAGLWAAVVLPTCVLGLGITYLLSRGVRRAARVEAT